MSLAALLGRFHTLRVTRLAPQGAYLAAPDVPAAQRSQANEVLLPRRELPREVELGSLLDVFVYLDSEDRPVATRRSPRLARGEVRFLRVRETTRIGAFVDWGLEKDLLVPFAEQTCTLAPGDLEPFGLILDRSERLAGTMRIRELLSGSARFELDEWVEAEAWREEPGIGVFCIIEGKYVGLLPASEPHALRRGQSARFRISHVQRDGKVELSLRGYGHEELDRDAESVLARLRAHPLEEVSERASPEQIRTKFGLSKKAFKRAVGRLLRDGSVVVDARGALRAHAPAEPKASR